LQQNKKKATSFLFFGVGGLDEKGFGPCGSKEGVGENTVEHTQNCLKVKNSTRKLWWGLKGGQDHGGKYFE